MITSKRLAFLQRIPCLGLLLALTSGIIFSSCAFAAEFIQDVEPVIIVIYRSIASVVFYGVISIFSGESLLGAKGERLFLFLRALFGFLAFSSGKLLINFIDY